MALAPGPRNPQDLGTVDQGGRATKHRPLRIAVLRISLQIEIEFLVQVLPSRSFARFLGAAVPFAEFSASSTAIMDSDPSISVNDLCGVSTFDIRLGLLVPYQLFGFSDSVIDSTLA